MGELKSTTDRGVVFASDGGSFGLVKLSGSIFTFDETITSMDTIDINAAYRLVCWVLYGSLVLEYQISWLIIVNNCNFGGSVTSMELLFCLWVQKVEVEILIWLPLVIIIDLHRNLLFSLSFFEFNQFVNCLKVFSLSCSVSSTLDMNLGRISSLVNNFNLNHTSSLRD